MVGHAGGLSGPMVGSGRWTGWPVVGGRPDGELVAAGVLLAKLEQVENLLYVRIVFY